MTTLKLSAATCAFGVIFLSAAPAYSGVGPHGLATVAPSSGQVESGEVASDQTASAGGKGFRIAPPGSHPDGKGYSAWIEAWTRWAVETKGSQHPLLDTTRDCSVNQKGRVWFIGGKFTPEGTPVERDCTVPSGTALFFPLDNEFWLSTPKVACIARDPFYRASPKDKEYALFRKQILNNIHPPSTIRTLSLEVDGQSAGRLINFFARSAVFSTRLPDDNIFDHLGVCSEDVPGFFSAPDVAWGHYIFLEPLSPGRHTLRWKANVAGAVFYKSLKQNITYHITVKP